MLVQCLVAYPPASFVSKSSFIPMCMSPQW